MLSLSVSPTMPIFTPKLTTVVSTTEILVTTKKWISPKKCKSLVVFSTTKATPPSKKVKWFVVAIKTTSLPVVIPVLKNLSVLLVLTPKKLSVAVLLLAVVMTITNPILLLPDVSQLWLLVLIKSILVTKSPLQIYPDLVKKSLRLVTSPVKLFNLPIGTNLDVLLSILSMISIGQLKLRIDQLSTPINLVIAFPMADMLVKSLF